MPPIKMGSGSWPTVCEYCDLAYLVKSGMLIAMVAQNATFALMRPISAYQKAEPLTVSGVLRIAFHCQPDTFIMLRNSIPKPRKPMNGTVHEIIWRVLWPVFGGEKKRMISLTAMVKMKVAQKSVGRMVAMVNGEAVANVAGVYRTLSWLDAMRYIAPTHSAMIQVSIPHQPAPITPRMIEGTQLP